MRVHASEEEAEWRNAARDDDRQHGVGQVQCVEDGVLRNGEQCDRHQHASHDHADGDGLATEVEFCGGIACHHRNDGADQCGNPGVDQGIQHPTPELATGPPHKLRIVGCDGVGNLVKSDGEPQSVAAGQLRWCFGGCDDGPIDWEEEVDQRYDEHDHGNGFGDRRWAHGARQIVFGRFALLFHHAFRFSAGAFVFSCCDCVAHCSFAFLSTSA